MTTIGADDERFMRQAIEAAVQGIERGQSPFGACIVKSAELLCRAHNVVWATADSTAHAEVTAIRAACQSLGTIDLSGCTIYSTCEPCPMCFSACHWAHLSRLVYGTHIDDARQIGFSELTISNLTMKELGHSPIVVVGDCLRDQNLQLFELWRTRGHTQTY